ncbi:MAG: 2-amino-4-hydroxy-6-hydroxymethyldihydropteridine diphosphokinase [Planctomycetota bacterium]
MTAAISSLDKHAKCSVIGVSTLVETEPVDSPDGSGRFLNGALLLHTDFDPEGLLVLLHSLEAAQGRVREVANGPRTLDLDLLVFGSVFQDGEGLVLPHPRMHERLFVLDSVMNLCPELKLARADQQSVRPVLYGGARAQTTRRRAPAFSPV